ncbi:XRE family transcriptional regulator [Spongiactinospora rosea]|uniref:XRE family transcriptional regulator n=1 Tax=Spongiactinospora rosea TaxID=2248750 RepID=A0A366M0A2_9ACTN|nr:XRE family transcriptional regulator [Spongiactinospora rosea]RBQ19621.1 XRE family transcriptional regulator [Spongiactinospora rosea]
MPDTPRQAGKSLAAKLDHLFRTVRPKGGGEYSFEEVSDTLKARGGPTISGTYIWQLRKGLRDNPTMRHLEALAGFFGVPPAYFFDDAAAERIDAELALLTALRDSSIRQIALRASGLSTKSLDAITEMLERVRELEGLGETGEQTDRARPE